MQVEERTMQLEVVKDYYGKLLKSSKDLKTPACCDGTELPPYLQPLLANVHPEVVAKYYGCGIVVPAELKGRRVLDLGSGSGRDTYILAQLAGPEGEVVGVDLTDEQLETAKSHLEWHRMRFGGGRSNVRFLKGYIEKLDELDLAPESFDVIVSNCVINLSIDKPAVFRGAHRLLKPGGELYFSDVYCDRRLPDGVRADPELYGAARSIGTTRDGLRGLRPGCDLQGKRRRAARRLRARRPSSHRARQGVSDVREHLAHAGRYQVPPAFRICRRFLHPLRHLPWLRHVDPVLVKRSAKSERRKLLLTLATAPRQMGGPWKALISRAG